MDENPTPIYSGLLLEFNAAPTTINQIYNFYVWAKNNRDFSDNSLSVSAALGNPPLKPSPPTLDKQSTNSTYARIVWTEGVSTDLSILGYSLYSDNMGNLEFSQIFNGLGSPNRLNFLHGPLETGQNYNYKVSVLTFNGESELSDVLSIKVCGSPK